MGKYIMNKQVAVTGEGVTDYGTYTFHKKNKCGEWSWGPVMNFFQLCLQERELPEFCPVQKEELRDIKLLRSDAGLEGRAIPARKFRKLCKERGLDYGIFYMDADRGENAGKDVHSARKHFLEVYENVCRGLSAEEEDKKFIPMIPLKMIECWLLTDENAFYECYGKKPDNPRLPKQPELIWGDKGNPRSDYPKCYLARVLENVGEDMREQYREIFCQLAENIELSVLIEKAFISFPVFYQDFMELYEELGIGTE